jgi:hypothetical protein
MIAVWLAGLIGGVATLLLARSEAPVARWRRAVVAAVVALALAPMIAVVALFTAAFAGLPALVALPMLVSLGAQQAPVRGGSDRSPRGALRHA